MKTLIAFAISMLLVTGAQAQGTGGGGGVPGGGGTGSSGWSAENLTFSATPTYSATKNVSRITLTSNVTGGTLPIGSVNGFLHCFEVTQGSGSYFTWPSNVIGGDAIGNASGGVNTQCFAANTTTSTYRATGPMRKDQLTITISSPTAGTQGTAYSQLVGTAGGVSPYTCTLLSGSVAGLTQTGCTIAGTPTSAGTTTLTEKVVDSAGNQAIGPISIVINASVGTAPRINYTDIAAGSATGADDTLGAYVTIFGANFGASKGTSTLTMNGGAMNTTCASCSWSNTKIVAKIGSGTTGNIVATVNSIGSNGYPFTVTATDYVYVATTGNDTTCVANNWTLPCLTWRKAFNLVTGNDNVNVVRNTILYFGNGMNVNVDDGRGYAACMTTDLGGTSLTNQLIISALPGATVNVGNNATTGGVQNGVKGYGKYITIANMNITGVTTALDTEAGPSRIVNNSISCPNVASGTAGTACYLAETQTITDTWAIYGNTVLNTGNAGVDKTYHAVYFSDGTNHLDFGWNNIGAGFKGYGRSFMSHATTGADLFDLHVHDNIVYNSWDDGIAMATANPSAGAVEVYNNVLYSIALSSNPTGVGNHAGIAVNTDPRGTTSGTVQAYNNTLYNIGAFTTGNQNGCFGVVTSGAGLNLTNNICQQPNSTQPYIETGSTNVTGSTNDWFGAGTKPSFDTAGLNVDPLFTSTSTPDFTLQSGSPAKTTGTTTGGFYSPVDIVGQPRGSTPSMGAYQQ